MLTMLFVILMFAVFGKLLVWAIRATWGITKVLFTFIFLPVILIGMAMYGLVYVGIIVLIIAGLVSLIGPKIM